MAISGSSASPVNGSVAGLSSPASAAEIARQHELPATRGIGRRRRFGRARVASGLRRGRLRRGRSRLSGARVSAGGARPGRRRPVGRTGLRCRPGRRLRRRLWRRSAGAGAGFGAGAGATTGAGAGFEALRTCPIASPTVFCTSATCPGTSPAAAGGSASDADRRARHRRPGGPVPASAFHPLPSSRLSAERKAEERGGRQRRAAAATRRPPRETMPFATCGGPPARSGMKQTRAYLPAFSSAPNACSVPPSTMAVSKPPSSLNGGGPDGFSSFRKVATSLIVFPGLIGRPTMWCASLPELANVSCTSSSAVRGRALEPVLRRRDGSAGRRQRAGAVAGDLELGVGCWCRC